MRNEKIELIDVSTYASHQRSWTGVKNEDHLWTMRNIEYARVDGDPLYLDLHMPLHATSAPLIVWVHGGAWRGGSKEEMPLGPLVQRGYLVASVDYRLSTVAPFPAQVHDIKSAIRFLRGQARHYGYDSKRIAIAGSSAGGHLAALVGLTNGHQELEGNVGDHLEQSSTVQAIVDYYGPSNLTTILSQSTPHGLSVRVPALQLLLGGQPDELPELARLASPTEHVDALDPPLLVLHGAQDPQVPLAQSEELVAKYREKGLDVQYQVLPEMGHGGADFFDDPRMRWVTEFLEAAW